MTPAVSLEPVTLERKSLLWSLFQLYRHDLSEHNGELPGESGTYAFEYFDTYWTEAGRWPYFIVSDGRIAGFVLVRELAPGLRSIAEFFVLRPLRRGGVGRRAAGLALARFPGRWRITQLERNVGAQLFWRSVADEASGGAFEETRESGEVVQTFETR